MIVRYSTTKTNLKKWLSENRHEHPVRNTAFDNIEEQPDLTQAAQLLHFMLKNNTNFEGVII